MKKQCFISFALSDKEFVTIEIIPILNELNVNPVFELSSLLPGKTYQDAVSSQMYDSDFVLVIGTQKNNYQKIEFDMSLALGKPVIAVAAPGDAQYGTPGTIASLAYDPNDKATFIAALMAAIEKI